MALTKVSRGLLSTSIDDNGNATAITIDSSENVLVGKASANTSAVGVEARANGLLVATRDGGQPLLIDRLTNDGDLVLFRKDSSSVGSASTLGGDFIVGSSSGSGAAFRMDGTNNQIYPSNATGSARDDAINLGASTVRWKDLYLSGNVNITNPAEDERGLSITDQQDGGQNLKFLYNASSNVGRVINDSVDQLRFNGAQGAMINTPSFSTYATSNQTTVTNSVATKINFGSQIVDTAGGHYATSTSRFTAPHDGTYFFSTSITYAGGDGVDDTMYIDYRVNGAFYTAYRFKDNWRYHSRSGIENTANYSLLIPLSENDYVEVFYSGTSHAITIDGGNSKFSGFAVSLT